MPMHERGGACRSRVAAPVISEPMIAIPSTLPTCRDVDTVADATPA